MPWQHAVGDPRGSDVAVAVGRDKEGRFGLMFRQLDAFAPDESLLSQLAQTMLDPSQRADPHPELDNLDIPSGYTFLGQFLDHDITRDTTPLDKAGQDPHALTNFRSPCFDLDSVYGGGPQARPELYDPHDRDKLLVTGQDDPSVPDDLPRDGQGSALIGDPRNDENLIVCQVHVGFLKFHNAMVDHVRAHDGGGNAFAKARQLAQFHYQWMVVHDFLPRFVGQDVVDELLEERDGQPTKVKLDFYKPRNPNRPFMPLEHSVAAYRFGHSIIRPGYVLNDQGGGAFFGDPASDADLHGGRPIPANRAIQFAKFFEMPGANPPVNHTRLIDTRLSSGLFHLPVPQVVPPEPAPPLVSLAERNLLRAKRLGLPAGQDVARGMGFRPLSNNDLGLADARWGGKAPLWYYVLKEAELQQGGKRLGQVGARIVAEVFLGLLDADHNSYLHQPGGFELVQQPGVIPGRYTIGDLLRFAGAG